MEEGGRREESSREGGREGEMKVDKRMRRVVGVSDSSTTDCLP